MNARRYTRFCTVCLLICLTPLACSRLKLAGKQAKETFRESSKEAILLKYAQENNAILNWKAPFAHKKRPLTVDFQRALVRLDGHPTALEAKPLDVFFQSEKLFVLLSVSDCPRKLNLVLEAPAFLQEQVSKLDLNEKKDLIVIADIESVDRPLSGASEPDVLVAHGKCVAIYGYDQPKPPNNPKDSHGWEK
jgi:hypothetical protein